jgi:CMP-N-acetylneuraminic acid synthetase
VQREQKIVALVPLRGGSKSIPFKNIKEIAGKPLCAWVLESGCNAKLIDNVYVSTDSQKIRETVDSLSLPVTILDRDPCLATDTASTESVMIDFMYRVEFDILVTIQATSPLTEAKDLDDAISQFNKEELDSMFTGVETKKFFWTKDGRPLNYEPLHRPRRQEFKGCIIENGAFYITKREILEKTGCRLGGKIGIYEMHPDSEYEIDEPEDWEKIKKILKEKINNGGKNDY